MGRNVWLVVFQPQRKFLSLSASAAGREALPAMDHGSPTKEEICAITGQPTTPSEPEKDFQKKRKFQSAWTTTKLLICKNHNKCDLNRRLIRGNGSYYNTATGEKKIKSNYLHVLLSCSTRLRASKTWKGYDQIITNFKGENERGCTAANTSQQHSPPRTEGGGKLRGLQARSPELQLPMSNRMIHVVWGWKHLLGSCIPWFVADALLILFKLINSKLLNYKKARNILRILSNDNQMFEDTVFLTQCMLSITWSTSKTKQSMKIPSKMNAFSFI